MESAGRERAHLLSTLEVSARSNQQPLAADEQTSVYFGGQPAVVLQRSPQTSGAHSRWRFWTVRAGEQLSAVLLEGRR